MITISVFEFRNNLAEYMRMAEAGEEISVTRFDKPVVSIVPSKSKTKRSIKDFKGFLGSGGETGIEYEDRIRKPGPRFN